MFLSRFEPVVSRGILCHSLNYNSNSAVQLRGLQLLQVLTRSPRIVTSLCMDVGKPQFPFVQINGFKI